MILAAAESRVNDIREKKKKTNKHALHKIVYCQNGRTTFTLHNNKEK